MTEAEILVRKKLEQMGYLVKYERPIPNVDKKRTPDWYVYPREHVPEFYVEVFSPSPTKETLVNRTLWNDLCNRIEKLQLGFGLSLTIGRNCTAPNAGASKKIVQRVEDWLGDSSPSKGETISLDYKSLDLLQDRYTAPWDGIVFTVRESGKGYSSNWCSPPVRLEEVSSDSLKENIFIKMKKYGRRLEPLDIPFVVCLVPHPDSLLAHDDVEEVLFGQSQTVVYIDPQGDNDILVDTRKNNGIFAEDKELSRTISAVIWLSRVKVWTIDSRESIVKSETVYYNPHATNPLPPDTFKFY